MPEITRLSGPNTGIELNFVERVHTPTDLMRLAVQTHLGGLSLSETRLMLKSFGIERARSTIHNWVNKSDLQPAGGCQQDQVALDETVVKVNGDRFWLFGAVDPETGRILHIRLFPQRTIVTTEIFLEELSEKHDLDEPEFLVDKAPWLQAALYERGLAFRHETFGDRNPVERAFQEIKRRTEQFYNTFSHADPETVDQWLKALAWKQNAVN